MGGLIDHAQDLFDKGYNFIPIMQKQKRPSLASWQQNKISQEQLTAWINDSSRQNDGVGILTEHTPAIDLDIQDQSISQHMFDFINIALGMGPNIVTRIGRAPKMLIPCKTDTPFSKLTSIKFKDDENKKHMIEILGTGQQYVAFGIHPDIHKDYLWSGVLPPADELPIITLELIQNIFREFERLCFEKDWTPITTTATVTNNIPTSKQAIHKKEKGTERRSSHTEDEVKHILDKLPLLDDYDNWLRIGMSLCHQYKGGKLGLELWHYYSKKLPNYNGKELDDKWPTFDTHNDQGNTLGSLLYLVNPPAQTQSAVITPNPAKHNTTQFWYSPYVFCAAQNKFVNIESLTRLSPDSFSNKYTSEVPGRKPTAAKYVLDRNLVPKVQHLSFHPGMGPTLIYKGETHLNTYVPPEITQDQTKFPVRYPRELDDFFNYLIPDPKERSLYVSKLKYVTLNPGKRVKWAATLIGPQGNGKTTSWQLTAAVLGVDYVTPISPKAFASQFNSFATGAIVGGFDEVRVHGENAKAVMDQMKVYITDDYIYLECKGQDPIKVPNYTTYFITSNRPDVLLITEDDRRYMIVQTVSTAGKIDFAKLHELIKNEPLSVKYWMEQQVYDPDFRPDGHAYKTKSTIKLINNVSDPLEDDIRNMMASGQDFINDKFVCTSVLLDRLNLNITNGPSVSTKLLTYKLLHMGWEKYPHRVIIGGHKYTLYIPNASELSTRGLTEQDIEDHLEKVKKDNL